MHVAAHVWEKLQDSFITEGKTKRTQLVQHMLCPIPYDVRILME